MGWIDADDSMCFDSFLVFSVPGSLPGRDSIFIFRLRLGVVLLMAAILRWKD